MLNKNTKLELDKTEYELELLVELQIQEDKKIRKNDQHLCHVTLQRY